VSISKDNLDAGFEKTTNKNFVIKMLNNFTPNNMREYYVKQSMKKTSGYCLKYQ